MLALLLKRFQLDTQQFWHPFIGIVTRIIISKILIMTGMEFFIIQHSVMTQ